MNRRKAEPPLRVIVTQPPDDAILANALAALLSGDDRWPQPVAEAEESEN